MMLIQVQSHYLYSSNQDAHRPIITSGFQELPGDLPFSELHFFSKFHELQQQGVAQSFAWLTGKEWYNDLIYVVVRYI